MELTKEQEKQMKRVFPNGWEESDIPAIFRQDEQEREREKGREIEDL